ncbi:MAG: hypothetical protein WBV31_18090 [Terriglobales bacterium]
MPTFTALFTTTRAMISDPKLPFAGESTSVGERKSSAEQSSAVVAMPAPVSRRAPSVARVWLRRIGVLLFVFLCATLGVMLMILPWRPEWSDNPLLLPYPELRAIVGSGFARGVSTGLGVLNVWIGFWEAIRYQEEE